MTSPDQRQPGTVVTAAHDAADGLPTTLWLPNDRGEFEEMDVFRLNLEPPSTYRKHPADASWITEYARWGGNSPDYSKVINGEFIEVEPDADPRAIQKRDRHA